MIFSDPISKIAGSLLRLFPKSIGKPGACVKLSNTISK
tara:strand:- start:114 stop:227 length:114 start_codon:yes stop_codon:yes gene_type:complete